MSAGQPYRWERVSSETRWQRDRSVAIPSDVEKLLVEGFLAPHRVRQAPGVYYYFGHLLAETATEKRNPKTRLKAWTQAAGLILFEDSWPIGPNAAFDLDNGRLIVSTASDEEREVPALFEIDWRSRQRRRLAVLDRPSELGLSSAFYLRDGGIAVRSRNQVRVLRREGDTLALTSVTLEVGDIIHLGVAGRLVVTPTAIWAIDTHGVTQVAEFPPVLGTCIEDFHGRVLRYTKQGCDVLIGPELVHHPMRAHRGRQGQSLE
jgi:hypothetical protein